MISTLPVVFQSAYFHRLAQFGSACVHFSSYSVLVPRANLPAAVLSGIRGLPIFPWALRSNYPVAPLRTPSVGLFASLRCSVCLCGLSRSFKSVSVLARGLPSRLLVRFFSANAATRRCNYPVAPPGFCSCARRGLVSRSCVLHSRGARV